MLFDLPSVQRRLLGAAFKDYWWWLWRCNRGIGILPFRVRFCGRNFQVLRQMLRGECWGKCWEVNYQKNQCLPISFQIITRVLIPKNLCCQIIRGNKKGKELKRKLLLWRWGGVGEDLGGGDAPTIQLQQPPSSSFSSHLLLLHLLLLLLQLFLHLLLLLISSLLPRSPPPSSARQPWGIAADNQCSWLEDCWTFVSHCPPIRPPQNCVYSRIELDSFVNSSINRLKLNPHTLHWRLQKLSSDLEFLALMSYSFHHFKRPCFLINCIPLGKLLCMYVTKKNIEMSITTGPPFNFHNVSKKLWSHLKGVKRVHQPFISDLTSTTESIHLCWLESLLR